MWLRDFLPGQQSQHPGLARLRVMTFGYSSLIKDDKNITGLDEWSLGLIQSVSAVRRSPSVRFPILFWPSSMVANILTAENDRRNGPAPSYSSVTRSEESLHVRYVGHLESPTRKRTYGQTRPKITNL